ncbi:MAG: decaprenyl-phosphate phosphoribosyltransferase [Phaeodactylibacter sp.]|nr:decaprenyl-phosphate phosphoribosyltransferase [Phaeodactylibacter sp.]MCB9274529.1 decaprenyl-phosphate phosphoribosyltransferase [Lewinellaceae bacterium]
MIREILISVRPYQWVKNVLVFAALIFSLSFLDPRAIQLSILVFVSFCLVSGSVYLINDIRDKRADSLHPVKKRRPIASGRLPVGIALAAFFAFLSTGLFLAYLANWKTLFLIGVYLALNLGYSFGLKRVVILDVMIVAIGFLIRAMAGAYAIDVAVSPWLFICTLLLALLLVLGKRRQELAMMEEQAGVHRKSLEEYSLPFIDGLMFVSAGAAIVTYSLYTIADEVVARFHTQWLIATTPLAIYGIFRYLYLVYIKEQGGDPTKMMIMDKAFVINGLLWVAMIFSILFYAKNIA